MRAIDLYSSEEICRELGLRCKRVRLQANLTQAELAGRCGASLSSIRRLESHGQGSLELLVRVAQALQLVSQLERFLVLPVQSIADAEREAAATQRQRAASPRKLRGKTPA